MSIEAEYRVQPHEPNYQRLELTQYERNDIKGLGGGLGCLTWGGIFLATYFLIGFVGYFLVEFVGVAAVRNVVIPIALVAAIIIASVGVAVLTLTIQRNRLERLEREKNENAHKAEFNRVTSEAASLTFSVANNYKTSTQLTTQIPHHVTEAAAWLRNAEAEFAANAYGPFWDAVENAAFHLSEFNGKANQLSHNASQYYENLNGRKHNFPVFPIQSTNLPDASPAVNDLRRVVRMGQTNFQFANIWEHRRTREVLIAGFQTLGEAINNLGSVIDHSIYDLQQSVSSDMARLVEEQIRTREYLDQRMLEQNRMLDNMQHHRKPAITDSPQEW